MDNFPHWIDHILAFILCIAIPLQARQNARVLSNIVFSSEQKKQFYISGSFSLLIMGAVVMTVWLLFKRPVSEIGLTQPVNIQSWWRLSVIFILVYLLDAFVPLLSKKELDKSIEDFKKRTPFLPTKKVELPEYLLLCFSAGVFEEIVYRGYLVNYCWYLFDGYSYQRSLSVFVPAFVFSVAHFYQGTKAVIKIFILSLFFGYIFIYSGSLLIVMLLHFLVNAISGLLTIKYMKEEDQQITDQDGPVEKDLSDE
ncbi:MAG TPA: type II CAAX endopeptidase family protein, partial [Chitinophagaceae bacterium]|nr:type II CAAX endopeptidase family protein [Chitinophagaceae bacterium]